MFSLVKWHCVCWWQIEMDDRTPQKWGQILFLIFGYSWCNLCKIAAAPLYSSGRKWQPCPNGCDSVLTSPAQRAGCIAQLSAQTQHLDSVESTWDQVWEDKHGGLWIQLCPGLLRAVGVAESEQVAIQITRTLIPLHIQSIRLVSALSLQRHHSCWNWAQKVHFNNLQVQTGGNTVTHFTKTDITVNIILSDVRHRMFQDDSRTWTRVGKLALPLDSPVLALTDDWLLCSPLWLTTTIR